MDRYLADKDKLHAGKKPREDAEALRVKDLANAYLIHKQSLLDSDELSPRTFRNAKEATDLLVARFGKTRLVSDLGQDDFADLRKWMAKKWGPVRLGDFIQRIRCVFKYGYDAELMPAPVRFGPGFARPTKKTLRLNKARKGAKMFEAEELLRILDKARQPLLAMCYLGVNCGFGNADVATLPLAAIDLDGGWIRYHCEKTGIDRKCPLWPETVEALRDAFEERPEPKNIEHAGLMFITYKRDTWHKPDDRNPISAEMRKLLDSLGIEGSRNIYALRHTFETIGGEAKDQVAVNAIMGHADNSMSGTYRERISDERLRAVTDHIRKWLFPAEATNTAEKPKAGEAAA